MRLSLHCRDLQATLEWNEAEKALATEQGFALLVARCTAIEGWGLVQRGRVDEGIEQLRQGLDAQRTTGAENHRPHVLALLAEAYGIAGQVEAGLHVLEEALTLVNNSAGRVYEAELHRLQGELLLRHATPDTAMAEACFHQALSVGRQQQAKSWELRAATSLARLWQQQDKRHEAYDLLAPVYEWFTEGFETVDLQEAKGLLEALKA